VFYKKISFTLILSFIFLLAIVSVAQAAPPMQTPDGGDSSLGDTIDLDETNDPGGKMNLGTVMSGENDAGDPDDVDDGTGDGADESDDGSEGDVDDGTDGDIDDGVDEGTDEMIQQHPVAFALSEFFDVPYDEVMGLHEAGNGFGNIARAYFFTSQFPDKFEGMDAAALLDYAHGPGGWGNIFREAGATPGNGRPSGPNADDGPPGQARRNGDPAELTGQGGNGNGNGNGIGNGNGNGNGNGKDNGRGKGNNK
jgi:hypothetical protein